MTRRRHALISALALLAALGSALPGGARPSAGDPAYLLVSFGPGADKAAAHALAGATPVRTPATPGGWELVRVSSPSALTAALRTYRHLPGVRFAEPEIVARAATPPPDDPCIWTPCGGTAQWNLTTVEAPLAWESFPVMTAQQRMTSNPVPVAVLDSRIDGTHPDFVNAGGRSGDATDGGQIDWSAQRSWVAPAQRSGSLAWHGTFVAGIVAAAAGNGIDIAGVAYPALVMPYEVLNGSGAGTSTAVAEAITAAHRAGARVINLSLGLTEPSQVVRDAMIAATTGARPALIVAAAGNNANAEPFYPASWPEAMSVSGVDGTGARASCSNFNDNVSVAAPARAVLSLAPMPTRLRTIDCGTSAAAPHVAGIAALLFAQDTSRTPDQVRTLIESTAIDDTARPGRDRYLGHGIANADRAVRIGASATATVGGVTAAVPRRDATTSTVNAVARSPHGVTAAEVYLAAPGSAAARFALRPVDGAWGDETEHLTGEVPLHPNAPAIQTLYVRAFDGSWGPVSRGRLVIDREPPRISNVRTDTVFRTWKTRPVITFGLSDDTAARFAYTVTVTAPDGVSEVWNSGRRESGSGPQAIYWEPPPIAAATPPGAYRVDIWAWDEAGNPATAAISALVV